MDGPLSGVSTQFVGASGFLPASGGRFCVHGGKSSHNYGLSVGKLSDKGEAAPHGFDIAAKGGNEQVTSFFQAGDAVLANIEDLGDALLSKPAGLSEIAERHFLGDKLCGAGFEFLAARCAEFLHLVI